jgi:hypothetical protein
MAAPNMPVSLAETAICAEMLRQTLEIKAVTKPSKESGLRARRELSTLPCKI